MTIQEQANDIIEQALTEKVLRLAQDRKVLLSALKAMAGLYDGLDDAIVHQRVLDKVKAARAAIAQAEAQ